MLTLCIVYIAAGLLLIALSIPLLLRKIKPNGLYGFRLAPALDNPEIWYATNQYAAKWLVAAGVSIVAAAVVLYCIPGLSLDIYALSCLAVFTVVLLPGLYFSLKRARAIAQRQQR